MNRLAEHLRYELAGDDAFEESFARGAELATGELLIDLDGVRRNHALTQT